VGEVGVPHEVFAHGEFDLEVVAAVWNGVHGVLDAHDGVGGLVEDDHAPQLAAGVGAEQQVDAVVVVPAHRQVHAPPAHRVTGRVGPETGLDVGWVLQSPGGLYQAVVQLLEQGGHDGLGHGEAHGLVVPVGVIGEDAIGVEVAPVGPIHGQLGLVAQLDADGDEVLHGAGVPSAGVAEA
jgi:hypothetical protein